NYNILPRLKVSYDFSKTGWNQIQISAKKETGEPVAIGGHLFAIPEIKSQLRSIYSDAEINFTPKDINSVTAAELDVNEQSSYRSSANLATEISQLLIDIESQDALDFAKWGKDNIGVPVDSKKIEPRLKRFTSAFHALFPTKRYHSIKNSNNKKVIQFEEH